MKKIYLLLVIISFFGCKDQQENNEDYIPSASEKVELKPEIAESISLGKTLYSHYCASCHLTNGKGIPNAFPPLDNSSWLKNKRKESISAVKNGLKGEIKVNGETYNSVMVNLGLSDQEVADVMNYTMNSWSNNIQPPVTAEEVAQLKN